MYMFCDDEVRRLHVYFLALCESDPVDSYQDAPPFIIP